MVLLNVLCVLKWRLERERRGEAVMVNETSKCSELRNLAGRRTSWILVVHHTGK